MERMESRGGPRLWVMGLTLPLALGIAIMLGIASAPASPAEDIDSAMGLSVALLFGVFLLLCGSFAAAAAVLWHKSRIPLSAYHRLIATLPDEPAEDSEETGSESRLP